MFLLQNFAAMGLDKYLTPNKYGQWFKQVFQCFQCAISHVKRGGIPFFNSNSIVFFTRAFRALACSVREKKTDLNIRLPCEGLHEKIREF